ncbi:MAG: energy transducer TonB [Acidobacteriia bacterium]|nr:energy transducer TonB [Terriglobia bacterium]
MSHSGVDLFKGAVWAGHPLSAAELRYPTIAEAEETFLKGMLETPWKQGRRSPTEWALSILVHVILVSAVVLAPLLFTQVLDLRDFQVMFLVAPRPPAAAPPPAMAAQKVAKPVAHLLPKTLMAPTMIPAKVQVVRDEVAPPELAIDGVVGGVPGGESGGVLGGIIGGIEAGAKPPPPPAKKEKILRVGGVVKAPRELYKPGPIYPSLALTARIQGVVNVDALIDEHGDVVKAQPIDGPVLLVPSAIACVLKWKYEPTYLDGDPVSIRMHVTVKFSLR